MTKKVTAKSAELFNEGRKEKIILKPEDFEKEITGRKKKPRTYINMWDDFLKLFIDIDVDIKIMCDLVLLTEKYINTFPFIEKLTENIAEQIYSIGLVVFLENSEDEFIQITRNNKTLTKPRIDELEKANLEFNSWYDKYMDYLYEISGISFEILSAIDSFKEKELIELMTPFLKIYSHANTYREILTFFDYFRRNFIFSFETWLEEEEYTQHIIIPDIEKNVVKRIVTRKVQKIFNFQKKEYNNLKKSFLENVRRAFIENN